MAETMVAVRIPEELYRESQKLVVAGFYQDLDELIRFGLHTTILLYSTTIEEMPSPGLTDGERMAFYLEKLRDQIRAHGGLQLGESPEEVIETLRRTRDEIWEEKYATHFGYK